jgi:hypothetical protein
MKNSLITYLLSFFFLITCFKSIGRPGLDTNSCLEIDGKIINAAEGIDGTCTVELICANITVESSILKDGKKKFRFILKKNQTYSIRLSKKGYVSKLISVNTTIPNDFDEIYKFSFETKLAENTNSARSNKEVSDFPIAIIYFDQKKDCFDYNKEYTSRIKKELAMN